MKTVLFVPGFKDSLATRNYTAALEAIEAKGYRAKFVPIEWRYTTLEDWVGELEAVYVKHNPLQTILAGFSFGAMTALVVAAKRNPAELWLCSLSPYFAGDIGVTDASWHRGVGSRRTAVFSELDFDQLAKQIRCPTRIFVGEREVRRYPEVLTRAQLAARTIPYTSLTVVPGADHHVWDPRYIEAIVAEIGRREERP